VSIAAEDSDDLDIEIPSDATAVVVQGDGVPLLYLPKEGDMSIEAQLLTAFAMRSERDPMWTRELYEWWRYTVDSALSTRQ
jgi:hypothetical protein